MVELHAVYFSCRRDVDLLAMSLTSLLRLDVCRSILVVVDGGDPFSPADRRRILELSERITIEPNPRPGERHGEGGPQTIASMMAWMGRALDTAAVTDYAVKLDSDTIVTGRRTFDILNRLRHPVVGSPIHLDSLTFFRGACYVLRKDVVDSLHALVSHRDFPRRIDWLLDHDRRVIAPPSYDHRYPEDRVVHQLIHRRLGIEPTMLDFVLDLDEPELPPQIVEVHDVLHFPASTKEFMPRLFARWMARSAGRTNREETENGKLRRSLQEPRQSFR